MLETSWVAQRAACRDEVIGKSRILWSEVQFALGRDVEEYSRTCKASAVRVDGYGGESAFRLALSMIGGEGVPVASAELVVSVEHASGFLPRTKIVAAWKNVGHPFAVKDQTFTATECGEDGRPILRRDEDGVVFGTNGLSRAVLEHALFENWYEPQRTDRVKQYVR